MPGRRITVINVPTDIGSIIKGKHLTPAAFQSSGLVDKLCDASFQVGELDALPGGPRAWSFEAAFHPNGARNEQENVEVNHKVKEAVSQSARSENDESPFLFIVGGECNIIPAIMSGLWHELAPKRVGLL